MLKERRRFMRRCASLNVSGQVWIETVVYTLIGLTLIGVVLALALPQINSYKDRVIVEQSIESMNVFDSKVREVIDSSAGNIRKVDFFSIRKGKIIFYPAEEKITLEINDLSKPYSEPGQVIKAGSTEIVTEKLEKGAKVSITLDYSEIIDLKYEGSETYREFAESSTPYSFSIENKGISNERVDIDIKEISGK